MSCTTAARIRAWRRAGSADQFLLGWARDFIAVLAPAGAGG